MDKSLPLVTDYYPPSQPPAARHTALRVLLFTFLTAILCFTWFSRPIPDHGPEESTTPTQKPSKCKQVPALFPSDADPNENLKPAFDYLFTERFQNASIQRLSSAVQIPTESFDDLGAIGEDKRWEVFYPFHAFLERTFPRIHAELLVEKVNTHGLVFTWNGTDEGKKPMVLMAHQDVVPVDPDTLDSWTFPPFSGHFDGVNIWGRGASDCKNQLIGTMESVEILLEAGWRPKRTVVLSYGFDEECSGRQGAGHLAKFLLERYGKNGVAAIIDEGMGYAEAFGRGFAVPGVAEKGYTDIEVVVRTPGGHSSVPHDHTSIGILAEMITAIEAVQYPTYLDSKNPYLEFLQCGAEYAPNFPKKLKKLLGQRSAESNVCKHNDRLALEAAKIGKQAQYLMQTSQAVDIIKGGTKTNALPEGAVAVVNHRINIGDSPETVFKHITDLAKPIAKKYNLTLNAFNGQKADYNAISLSNTDTTLEVAPVTPTVVDAVSPYSVISGTIRALYGEDTIVAPALMTGNTDTRYYWALTKNIFRFGPGYVNDDEHGLGNIHTVNERVSASNHFKVVRWFTLFLRNMDEAELEVD
ncbi:carboxypeptidase S [Lecanosticta acicola]|uniref:Carboxypeptidase S n=1 Tax=Lecanosticta acicola TaxID=111012 RepID=A0AAI9EBY9_9PEZI|nr:carboxypeptidase S [Lecanosticta acicola]